MTQTPRHHVDELSGSATAAYTQINTSFLEFDTSAALDVDLTTEAAARAAHVAATSAHGIAGLGGTPSTLTFGGSGSGGASGAAARADHTHGIDNTAVAMGMTAVAQKTLQVHSGTTGNGQLAVTGVAAGIELWGTTTDRNASNYLGGIGLATSAGNFFGSTQPGDVVVGTYHPAGSAPVAGRLTLITDSTPRMTIDGNGDIQIVSRLGFGFTGSGPRVWIAYTDQGGNFSGTNQFGVGMGSGLYAGADLSHYVPLNYGFSWRSGTPSGAVAARLEASSGNMVLAGTLTQSGSWRALKTHVKPMAKRGQARALDWLIDEFTPVSYRFKAEGSSTEAANPHLGFLLDDMPEDIREIVTDGPDGGIVSRDVEGLLMTALKEAGRRMTEMGRRLEKLEAGLVAGG